MKPRADLVRGKRFVFDPGGRLLERLTEARQDHGAIDAEVLVRRAIGAGPAPNPSEHAAVKTATERLVDGVPATRQGPRVNFKNGKAESKNIALPLL
ncbi:MAG: hypothetical protein ABSF67_21625 [Roseiarcus sp.]